MTAGLTRCFRANLSHRAVRICLPLLVCGMAGCNDYRWTSDYQSAEDYAHQQKKYLFIFYKWWLSNESSRMHQDVLLDPAVGSHLRDTVNVLLEKESSPEYGRYMSKYGVTAAPAFVIVAPDGSYQVRVGFLPKDRFIEFIESAKTVRPRRGGSPAPPPARSPVLAP